MPAVLGTVNIQAILNSSIFQTGDTCWISPYDRTALFAGAGSYKTKERIQVPIERSHSYLTKS